MKMRRAVAALLAASMVVGSVGCMQKSDSGNKKTGSKQEHVEAPADPLGKYEETVKITTVLPENAGIQWQEGDSYDDNPWYRAYKERLNIEVKNDWVSNDYATKLNLTIAEGEKSLPDVFCVGEQNFQQLIDGNLIWDLTDLYEKYASDRIKGYMEQEKDVFELAKRDGKLMGIPQLSFGIIDQPKQVWVRQDWAEEAGIKEINTIADLDKAARTLKEKHGKYGIAEDQKLDSFKALTNAWGAHMGYWEERDGEIVYGSVQP